MPTRFATTWEPPAAQFVRDAYQFVATTWQHAPRDDTPDQGFERLFREHCMARLNGWKISSAREMHLGATRETASGTLHEIDLVALHDTTTAIAELKNYQIGPDKNDVIVFHAKLLDYVLANADLTLRELCFAFIASKNLEDPTLSTCFGLGIHPITPQLRPLPVLVQNATYWQRKIHEGANISNEIMAKFEDFCATLSKVAVSLSETWPSNRFGYQGPNRIVVRTAAFSEWESLLQDFRSLNADCLPLKEAFDSALR
jgi:hypothetical protein